MEIANIRDCPLCGEREAEELLHLEAARIVANANGYAADALELLRIDAKESFPVARCCACGFVYSRRLLAGDRLDVLYDRVIEEDVDRREEQSLERLQDYLGMWCNMVESFDMSNPGDAPLRVLDFGAGYGSFLEVARAPQIEVFGFETSARRRSHMASRDIRPLADLHEVRREMPFHFVMCNQVLEHVPDPDETVGLLSELLHPRGRMYLSVPHYPDSVVEENAALVRAGDAYPADLNPWEHLNYFSPEAFVRLVERHGLEVQRWPLIRPWADERIVTLSYVAGPQCDVAWTTAILGHSNPDASSS